MAYDISIQAQYSAKPGYVLRLYVRRENTNVSGNQSSYAWQCTSHFVSGSNLSYFLDPYPFGVTVGSETSYPSHNLDFRGTDAILIGAGFTGWFGHDSGGYCTLGVRTWASGLPVFGNAETGTQWFYTDRIAQSPDAPGWVGFQNLNTTSVDVLWGAAAGNGADIDAYLLRMWPNSSPSGPYTDLSTDLNTGPRTVTNLVPGKAYTFAVYAHSAVGFGPPKYGYVTTKSGAYVGADSAFPAGEVLAGVGGSFTQAQIFFCETASGPFVEAK